MHRFFSSAAVLLLGSATALAQAALPTGDGHYTITQAGKPVGDAQYAATAINGGDTLTSSGQIKVGKFSYTFHSTATVDAQANLVRHALSGSVHGVKVSGSNIQFTTASDPTGRSLQININADGKLTSNTVDRHRNTVLAPDLDPAAYSLMVHFAMTQPHTAWVLIPKENGILVPADYQSAANLSGTLNGQNITVKHAIVAISDQNSIVIELFYTPGGQLLEADLNAQNFYVTHDGFKLLNRPKPVAPPHGAAPAPNGQPGQQGQPVAPAGQSGQPVPQAQ